MINCVLQNVSWSYIKTILHDDIYPRNNYLFSEEKYRSCLHVTQQKQKVHAKVATADSKEYIMQRHIYDRSFLLI